MLIMPHNGMASVKWICLAQDRNKGRACESGNETSGSIKGGKFLGWLKYY
jgi:hypothetical protein